MAQVQEAIRGSRPDMSRNQSLAGQTVQQGKYEVTYNDNGYATKAVNTEKRAERQQNSGGGVPGELAGTAADPTGGFGDTYLGISGSGGGSGGGSSGGSRGSSSGYYESIQPTDLSGYLNDMYNAYNEAQLSALKSAYEQNLADLQAQAEKIPETYQTARNEAASQNDIARMAWNEYANARGLNTGTSGQAALANSAVLQSNLTDISTQESDALAENALQQNQLAIQYRNAAVQAQAEGNYQLAQALYNEYVRQDNAAMQTAQLAQEQANWEAQFNAGLNQWQQEFETGVSQWNQQFQASQQEYQDSLASQQREYAYNLAMTMLGAGVMPDTNTLNQAGISTADALNMRMAAAGGTSGVSGSGGRASSSSSSGGKSSGSSSSSTSGSKNTIEMNPSYFNAFAQSLAAQLAGSNQTTTQGKNNLNAAIGNVDSRWNELSSAQKQKILGLLARYGIEYTP